MKKKKLPRPRKTLTPWIFVGTCTYTTMCKYAPYEKIHDLIKVAYYVSSLATFGLLYYSHAPYEKILLFYILYLMLKLF